MKRIKKWETFSKLSEGSIILPESKTGTNLTNLGLKTLEGLNLPEKTENSFTCEDNELTTLKGSPKEVGFSFDCSNNELESLEYGPSQVERIYFCYTNKLTSLEGSPLKIETFICDYNNLKDLKGAPKIVTKSFSCGNNPLTSLEGAPEEIGEDFNCGEFTIRNGKWGIEGWLEILENGTAKAKTLILTLLTEDRLDKFILEDPTRLHLLDETPNLKADVIKRTGVKDLSRLGRTIKTGLL